MHQQTFAEVTFEQYRKPTRHERFFDEMNRVVPWAELVAALSRCIPRIADKGGQALLSRLARILSLFRPRGQ